MGRAFRHNEQSLRIVDVLERNGAGLNLTDQVREGIYMHSKARRDITMRAWGTASTLEGQIVKLCDAIAYINHDIDDAIRGGLLRPDDLPRQAIEVLGETHGQRLDTMVCDLIDHNWWATGAEPPPDPPELSMSPDVLKATNALREFLYERVYFGSKAKADDGKVHMMIELLYRHFMNHPEQLPADLLRINQERSEPIERAVVDYIAGMTDRFALKVFNDLYVPRTWSA